MAISAPLPPTDPLALVFDESNTTSADPNASPDLRKRNKGLLQEISACKNYRRKLSSDWSTSIDYRRGKPFTSQRDEDRIAVPMDWALTKQKIALLFSQVPPVHISHPPQTTSKEVTQWLHNFEQRINDTAHLAGAESAMEEVLPDCINAAGIGVAIVAHEAITEDVEVPAIDMATFPPQVQEQIKQSGTMPDGTPVPMTTVPRVIDSRYTIDRISPSDFLWPISFTGSDFNKAPWIGRTGRILWPEAVKRFKLDPDKKSAYVGDDRNSLDRLNQDADKEKSTPEDEVTFDEIFYHNHKFDVTSKSYTAIHHTIFISGVDEPVIDEDWKGQQFDQKSGQLIGAQRYAIQVLTLTYITDDAIPPSDSAMGRPQVNELNKSRTQMIQQRDRSMPLRWIDTNRADPTIVQAVMRGVWQHVIPVQGQGTNIIGEIPRSSLPAENYNFDRMIKQDSSESWQVGQGAIGSDIETKAEVNAVTGNMNIRVGRERAKVGRFYTNLTEILGGLISIYEDPASIGEGFSPLISRTLVYSIIADSSVLLDSQQRIKRLMDFINFTAKSGWVNLEPVMKEIATLSGLDPGVVIQPPKPRGPVEPNISLRLTGTEDMLNPLTLAFLMKSGQAPEPELIEKAKKLIEAAVTPPMPPQPPAGGPGMPPGGPGGPGGLPMPGGGPSIPPSGPPGAPMPPIHPPGAPVGVPLPPPPPVGGAHPDWSALDRVNSRVLDRK